jgi:hypothetical protein
MDELSATRKLSFGSTWSNRWLFLGPVLWALSASFGPGHISIAENEPGVFPGAPRLAHKVHVRID